MLLLTNSTRVILEQLAPKAERAVGPISPHKRSHVKFGQAVAKPASNGLLAATSFMNAQATTTEGNKPEVGVSKTNFCTEERSGPMLVMNPLSWSHASGVGGAAQSSSPTRTI